MHLSIFGIVTSNCASYPGYDTGGFLKSSFSAVTLTLRLKSSDVHKIFPTSVLSVWVSSLPLTLPAQTGIVTCYELRLPCLGH